MTACGCSTDGWHTIHYCRTHKGNRRNILVRRVKVSTMTFDTFLCIADAMLSKRFPNCPVTRRYACGFPSPLQSPLKIQTISVVMHIGDVGRLGKLAADMLK